MPELLKSLFGMGGESDDLISNTYDFISTKYEDLKAKLETDKQMEVLNNFLEGMSMVASKLGYHSSNIPYIAYTIEGIQRYKVLNKTEIFALTSLMCIVPIILLTLVDRRMRVLILSVLIFNTYGTLKYACVLCIIGWLIFRKKKEEEVASYARIRDGSNMVTWLILLAVLSLILLVAFKSVGIVAGTSIVSAGIIMAFVAMIPSAITSKSADATKIIAIASVMMLSVFMLSTVSSYSKADFKKLIYGYSFSYSQLPTEAVDKIIRLRESSDWIDELVSIGSVVNLKDILHDDDHLRSLIKMKRFDGVSGKMSPNIAKAGKIKLMYDWATPWDGKTSIESLFSVLITLVLFGAMCCRWAFIIMDHSKGPNYYKSKGNRDEIVSLSTKSGEKGDDEVGFNMACSKKQT